MPASAISPFSPRRILLYGTVLVLVALGIYVLELAIPKRDYFVERRGTLVTTEILASSDNGTVQKTLRLESSSGLMVRMRVSRPATAAGETLPVIIVMGGENTGKDAVDLLGDADGIAFAAIDYPYDGDRDLDGFWKSIYAVPDVQRAFLDSPPAVSLALWSPLSTVTAPVLPPSPWSLASRVPSKPRIWTAFRWPGRLPISTTPISPTTASAATTALMRPAKVQHTL